MKTQLGWLAGITGAVMLVGGATQAAPIAAAPDSDPAYDYYGMFLGSWAGNISDSQLNTLETLIKNQWSTTTPFSQLGDVVAGCPLCNQLSDAGKTENPAAPNADGRIQTAADTFKDGDEPIAGAWKYLPGDPNVEPGNGPVDFYLTTKYDGVFSVFYFGIIEPDAAFERRWATDLAILQAALLANQLLLVDPASPLQHCASTTNVQQQANTFMGLCVGQKNGNTVEVSHIQGLWPDRLRNDVPEPAMLGLFGLGLLGLGVAGRRRLV